MNNISPTSGSERIISLDILRGFAILGILIMNMISFSMVSAHYLNPMAEGVLSGIDEWAFWFSELFANQKFMSLFSILFGAGIVLMTNRMAQKGSSPAKRHYIRNFWLLVIGLIHAYCIWFGDILVQYAICAIWVYLFRNTSAKTLYIVAAGLFLVSVFMSLFAGFTMPYWGEEQIAETCVGWTPGSDEILAQKTAYQGSWLDQMPYRSQMAFFLEGFLFVWGTAWQITALMLIGMGLYKSKVITAEKSSGFYKKMSFIGIGIGLILGVVGLILNYQNDWSCEYSFFLGSQFTHIGSVPMALGYVGIMMYLCKSDLFNIFKKWLAPVGRMALTNYLMQSIIATLIFYGHGLGLFGTVNRAEQWFFILGIWIVQIFYSRWWLSRYNYGPFEWLWRSLTYAGFQKM